MIFKGIGGQSLELKIQNYQFPDIIGDEWDSNWLRIYLDVKSRTGHWQTVDPCLTTGEVAEIVTWLRDLSQNKEIEYKTLGFTEPNLEIELTENNSNQKRIKVSFYAESRPQSAKEEEEYYIEGIFTNFELASLARDLEKELNEYPSR